jgi:hypothetical protein
VTHGYLLHCDEHHLPDTYTATFYQEMLDRTRERLLAAWPRDDRKAVVGALLGSPLVTCRHGAEAVAAAAEAADPEPALALLPRGPREDELGVERSTFLNDWAYLSRAVAAEAGADLRAVQPARAALRRVSG